MTEYYDTMRLIRAPGVQTTHTFKPALITPRLRNSLVYMIESRVVEGNGAAATLARSLLRNRAYVHIGATTYNSSIVRVNRGVTLPEPVAAQCAELLEAGYAVWAATNDVAHSSYYRVTTNESKAAISSGHVSGPINIRGPRELRLQFAEALASATPPADDIASVVRACKPMEIQP